MPTVVLGIMVHLRFIPQYFAGETAGPWFEEKEKENINGTE
jgi:hypothetical protein